MIGGGYGSGLPLGRGYGAVVMSDGVLIQLMAVINAIRKLFGKGE